ncbi:MAG: formylglycine-generating enzyme family protein [Thermoguttaceae bacterium]|nr:formylglycine-generating enzyme family protein [Thermoguttaceae bacterium]
MSTRYSFLGTAFLTLILAVSLGCSESTVPQEPAAEPESPPASPFDATRFPGGRETLTIEGVEFAFRYCPEGTFIQGASEGEGLKLDRERPARKVTISKGFWLQETETTQAQWTAVAGSIPSGFQGENLPVESVSWNDCQALAGLLNDSGVAPEGWEFSLPTEAQWEYACRAGTTTAYFWGDSLNGDRANCNGEAPYRSTTRGPSLGKTQPVGSYEPNAWGLSDMNGNVWEWCKDAFDAKFYQKRSADDIDPENDAESAVRVERGGSWYEPAASCRAASRNGAPAATRSNAIGFRLALVKKG